jgi:hypothetical protein
LQWDALKRIYTAVKGISSALKGISSNATLAPTGIMMFAQVLLAQQAAPRKQQHLLRKEMPLQAHASHIFFESSWPAPNVGFGFAG